MSKLRRLLALEDKSCFVADIVEANEGQEKVDIYRNCNCSQKISLRKNVETEPRCHCKPGSVWKLVNEPKGIGNTLIATMHIDHFQDEIVLMCIESNQGH